eukprot:CAMPEP_0197436710 /NCGR_PEP_ID=MMETSP1175-20131217/4139_1 /TAXON_ID=1003142 /ORGANISM="Triceratium dubium, Strain CCMP147" /LENGTH=225 /DNA_ID=CAMNT_0042966079 /DNA_START=190 /DNA_END=867 /DNA_ORIENTATION=+
MAERGGPLSLSLAVFIADIVPFFPSQPLAILAGAVFGFTTGLLFFELGQALAVSFCILVGRFVLSRRTKGYQSIDADEDSKLAQVLEELTSGLNLADCWKVFVTVLVARQSPVIPWSLGNYFVGASTSAMLMPAILGTVLAVVPGNLMLCGAGAGALALVKAHGFVGEGLEVIGVVATLILVYVVVKAIQKVYRPDRESDMEMEPLADSPSRMERSSPATHVHVS